MSKKTAKKVPRKPRNKIEANMSKNKDAAYFVPQNRTWEHFIEDRPLELYPADSQWVERLVYTLLTWAEQEDSLEVMQFLIKYKIPKTTFHDWLRIYPKLAKGYSNAKLMLASRRRTLTMTKQLDGYYAYKDIHLYDPEFDEVNRYWADLKARKKDDNNKPSTFIVYNTKPEVLSKEKMLKMQQDMFNLANDNEEKDDNR